MGLFGDNGYVLPLTKERLKTFISCHKYTSDGLRVLMQFMQLKKTVHFQYFYKVHNRETFIWTFVDENVLYQKCDLEEKCAEE
jgi:hypothetical protein